MEFIGIRERLIRATNRCHITMATQAIIDSIWHCRLLCCTLSIALALSPIFALMIGGACDFAYSCESLFFNLNNGPQAKQPKSVNYKLFGFVSMKGYRQSMAFSAPIRTLSPYRSGSRFISC